jgi:hypothetical protein
MTIMKSKATTQAAKIPNDMTAGTGVVAAAMKAIHVVMDVTSIAFDARR